MNLNRHAKVLLNGAVVVAPAIITGYVVVKAVLWLDDAVREALNLALHRSFRGLGIAVGLVLIYVVGLLARSWVFGWIVAAAEEVVGKVPLVHTLYSAIRDMLQLLAGDKTQSRGKPAVVQLRDGQVVMLGLVTQEQPGEAIGGQDRVAVYLPMSYQLGGYTVYVPRQAVREIEGMSVETLLKLALIAGAGTPEPPGNMREPSKPAGQSFEGD